MEKSVIQDLISIKSERIKLEDVKGKSDVWSDFQKVILDGEAMSFVSCKR